MKYINGIQVDITDKCILNCIMCDQPKNVHNVFMDWEVWKRLVDDMDETSNNFFSFTLSVRGESMLHPMFSKFLEYLFNKKRKNNRIFRNFYIHTNANLMDEEKRCTIIQCAKLLKEPDFFKITCSLDAISQKIYESIRIGGNFQVAVRNVRELIKLKFQQRAERLAVDLQFIVMQENFREVEGFAEYWGSVFKKNNLSYIINSRHDGLISENTISFVVRHPVTPISLELHNRACELLGLKQINKKDLTGEF